MPDVQGEARAQPLDLVVHGVADPEAGVAHQHALDTILEFDDAHQVHGLPEEAARGVQNHPARVLLFYEVEDPFGVNPYCQTAASIFFSSWRTTILVSIGSFVEAAFMAAFALSRCSAFIEISSTTVPM